MKKVMKKEKMPWAVILSFGLLFAGWSFAWAIYNNFVPIFLQAGNINFDKAGVVLISEWGSRLCSDVYIGSTCIGKRKCESFLFV